MPNTSTRSRKLPEKQRALYTAITPYIASGVRNCGPTVIATAHTMGYTTPEKLAAAHPRDLRRGWKIGPGVAAALIDAAKAYVEAHPAPPPPVKADLTITGTSATSSPAHVKVVQAPAPRRVPRQQTQRVGLVRRVWRWLY